jgi:hypothetical protein
MAHFINARGARISNTILYVPVDSSVTIGVWGAAGLNVGPNDSSMAVIKDLGPDKNNNRWFSLSPRKIGNVMVEAKQGASVWDYFQLAMTLGVAAHAFPQPGSDGRYTNSPNERLREKTIVSPTHALQMVRANWAALSTLGQRMLVAQFMIETGDGESCHNWNLGNIIAAEDQPHFYKSAPDCVGAGELKTELATNLTSEPTTADKARIKCNGLKLLIFHPPHPRSRFRDYDNIADGGRSWVMIHRGYGNGHPEYPDALNNGDFDAMAAIMKLRKYFTSDEARYAKELRRRLGLVH